jgi:Cu+-exporting ATPase
MKIKFKINDMHCVACAMNIDGGLEDLTGVKSVSTNFAKSETEVEFDPALVNSEILVEEIKKVGYTAISQ